MIVTLDGPAGTGKSTVARAVAQALGFDFLDTGAMYRAIGLEAIRRGLVLTRDEYQRLKEESDLPPEPTPGELAHMAKRCRIEFDWPTDPPAVLLNDEVVTHLLRSDDTTRASSFVATVPAIREQLVAQQREIGREHSGKGMVTEGRDQGTVVFPEAEHKFFLTADVEERAKRRVAQLRERGDVVDEQQILKEMIKRDKRDTEREIAPLMPARDAALINTTKMSQPEVIDHIVGVVRGGGATQLLEQEAQV